MSNYTDVKAVIGLSNYEKHFWDEMRFRGKDVVDYHDAYNAVDGAYYVPEDSAKALRKAIADEGAIRAISTNLTHYEGTSTIWASESDDVFEYVPEGGQIPGFDAEDDIAKFPIRRHKLAGLVKMSSEFAYDVHFDLKKHLTARIAKSAAKAEDASFVSGDGTSKPFGLLHPTAGAETGVTTESLSYDDVIDLFFSVKPEYRKKATWVMNDSTALALRKLTDDDGAYLWDGSVDDLLGRPVVICNDMPDIEAGSKPMLFGDFRYYWIVDQSPISIRALKEAFAQNDRVGYLTFEFLDARLVRRDAVKCLALSGGEE